MLIWICIGLSFCILFYIITYPYTFKLKRKLKKITSYPEVAIVENPTLSEQIYSSEIHKTLSVEKKWKLWNII